MRLPLGSALIFCLAIVSAILVALIPHREPEGITFWVFAAVHRDAYIEPIAQWNKEHPESPFEMSMLHPSAIEHRMISGFLSSTPVADLLETHEGMYPRVYGGPIEQIGFLDITDRLHEEGLYEQYDQTSLLQHSHRGRHFGLPLTATPALLAYRSDLVEAAGPPSPTSAILTTWITGPGRVATDVALHTSAGHKQRLDGYVVGTVISNWMLAVWKRENP